MKLRMICSAALVLFVLVFCCACQYAFSIPEQGEYYCAEYNATLHFESNGTYVMVANDEKIGLYIDYGNNVFSTDYTLRKH